MALTNNNLNLQMASGSFLRNKLYNSNSAISQQQYLNILLSKPSPTKTSPKKLRRSKRVRNKEKATNIQINMDDTEDVWICKCCGQLDINQTKSNCTVVTVPSLTHNQIQI
eukprot:204910_1